MGAAGENLGGSRDGFTTKIHLRTNGLGLPVAIALSPGEASDIKGYEPVMDEPGPLPRVLIADKGYDSHAIRGDLLNGLRPWSRFSKPPPLWTI